MEFNLFIFIFVACALCWFMLLYVPARGEEKDSQVGELAVFLAKWNVRSSARLPRKPGTFLEYPKQKRYLL